MILVFAGCFDSLVDDHCARGFTQHAGECVAHDLSDAGMDGSSSVSDAPPSVTADAWACAVPELRCGDICVDPGSDPDNCGTCGHVCASGVCTAGACEGRVPGHIVAIGHDYRHHHAGAARVLGNAVGMAARADVGVAVARWRGTALDVAVTGTTAALTSSMQQQGRWWFQVSLPATPSPDALDAADVLLVDAQVAGGDALEAQAAAWAGAIATFMDRGGIVVVLEGRDGVSYRFARGAGLYDLDAPVEITGQLAIVVDGSDAIAAQVVSPYLAEDTSVAFPTAADPVVATSTGQAIVLHVTR